MITKNIAAGLVLSALFACHSEKTKTGGGYPPIEKPRPAPIVSLGLSGGVTAASIDWTLPKFLEGQFKDLDKADAEAALDIELTKGDEKKAAHVNSGFTAKSCNPVSESETFVATLAAEVADNVPDSLKTDVDEISSWTAESTNFKGRAYLKKRYKSEGETGIYRIDVLLANEKTSECVLWNLVFTPEKGVSAEFIEASSEYQELTDSLAATWKGIGADFTE